MLRGIIIIILLNVLLVSCKKDTPKGTLPEKQVIEMLTEVHLIDGYLNTLNIDSSRKIIDALYEQVFQRYGIDSVLFEQNLKHYLSNPVEAEDMYKTVNAKLKSYETTITRQDSILHARTQDSLTQVNRWNKMEADRLDMLMNTTVDTIPATFQDFNNLHLGRLRNVHVYLKDPFSEVSLLRKDSVSDSELQIKNHNSNLKKDPNARIESTEEPVETSSID